MNLVEQVTPCSLSEEQARAELEHLAKIISHYDHQYYLHDSSYVSDEEYDNLRKRNKDIEQLFPHLTRQDSPSRRVGISPCVYSRKHKHRSAVLSLESTASEVGLSNFIRNIKGILGLSSEDVLETIAEPKIDGLSCSLTYENGYLTSASTRGDGKIGEDVTENAMVIHDIPKVLMKTCFGITEIRGEVYINRSDFISLNMHQKAEKKAYFSNLRNTASGLLRRKRNDKTKILKFIAHGLSQYQDDLVTYESSLKLLEEYGFRTNEHISKCKTLSDMSQYYRSIEEHRAALHYDIDGVVYKVNNLDWQASLGESSRSPKWAIAYKFYAEKVQTTILDIKFQIGRQGSITPVAILEPVSIHGVIIKKATLHSIDRLRSKDIRIGDHVVIRRAGGVVPQIISSFSLNRLGRLDPFPHQKKCPSCGNSLVERGKKARCVSGISCPDQAYLRVRYFSSPNAFGIKHLSKKTINFLFKSKAILEPQDLFTLEDRLRSGEIDLSSKGKLKKKLVDRLLLEICRRRRVSLENFIYALGIDLVGSSVAMSLANHYVQFSTFKEAMVMVSRNVEKFTQDLLKVKGIGPKILLAISNFFFQGNNNSMVETLANKLTFVGEHKILEEESRQNLKGKVVVFTGVLSSMTRGRAELLARSMGAEVSGSVSSKTSYVIIGDKAGRKAIKASALGVQKLDEFDWLNLLGKKPHPSSLDK